MREMKNSGIEWIGVMPSSWKIEKAKYDFYNTKTIVGNKVDEYQRLALTMNGVISRSKEDNTGLQPEKFETYQILKKDELVFKLIDLQNISTSRVGLSQSEGLVSPAYIIIHSNGSVLPSFAEKWFVNLWRTQVFNHIGDDGVRSSLNSSDLLNIPIAFPETDEQQSISVYLDSRCSKISALAADIQTQIDTLEQYKRSIITEAVTKGLNSNAEMKDSGVQWIGKVPKSWKVDKLKYHLHRNEPRNPGDKTVLSLYRDYGVVIKDSRDDNHNVTSEDTSNYKYVRPGDFVINKMKAWQGSVAVSKYEGIVSPAYFVYEFTDDELYKPYFHYLLRSCYQEEFRRLSGGIRVGQWDLPSTALDNTLVLLPPLDEQKSIANYLNMQCSEIDKVIADKNEQLATIDEYKKSLIYEYVTGKKEVPTA